MKSLENVEKEVEASSGYFTDPTSIILRTSSLEFEF